jgi:hypothetical protein
MCSMNNHADLWRRAELIRAARAAALDIEAPEERRQAVEESGLLAAAFLAEVAEHFAAYQGRVGETAAHEGNSRPPLDPRPGSGAGGREGSAGREPSRADRG